MQKHQINVVGFQLAHGFQHRLPRLVVPIMLHPNLGGQEDLTSRYAGFGNCLADLFLIEITLRRVNVAVADRECVQHAPLAFILGYLVNPVAELRHFYSV